MARLLLVMGEGGHTKEMVKLADLLGPDHTYHYLLVKEDRVSADKITRPGPVYRVNRPRFRPGKRHDPWRDASLTLLCAAQALPVLWRVRPQAILSTGPWVAVPVMALGKLFGAQIIFIETGSRVRALSATGKVMYRLATLFFVQWPDLLARYPRARYAGRLW